jgi:uncharacterized protein (TIGR03086 family)
VRDVVNHITSENLWAEPLLQGKTIEEVGDRFDGDVLGDDPVSTWGIASRAAGKSFQNCDLEGTKVHLSFGDTVAVTYLEQMTSDLVVHAWDIAKGSGQDDSIPSQLVDVATRLLEPLVDDGGIDGVFAAPVEVEGNADDQTRLLALVGRRRNR